MIFGVDLGVRSYHAIGMTAGGSEVLIRQVELAKGHNRYSELRDITLSLQEFIHEGDLVFVEEPPMAGIQNKRTFGQLSMTAGAILSATSAQGYLVPVDSWKKAVVGRGGAAKADVARWLGDNHPELHAECHGDQNLVDAACIALYGCQAFDSAAGIVRAFAGDLDHPL